MASNSTDPNCIETSRHEKYCLCKQASDHLRKMQRTAHDGATLAIKLFGEAKARIHLGIIREPDWSDQKWDIDCPESPNWTMTRKK
jgi:hypothetical protein